MKKLILIFLILISAATISVVVYRRYQPVEPNTAPMPEIKEPGSYTGKYFSFKYPPDWQIITTKREFDDIKITITTISSSNSASITVQNASIFEKGKPLNYEDIIKGRFIPEIFTGPEKIKIGDREIDTYTTAATPAGTLVNYLTIPFDGGPGNYLELSFDYADISYKKILDQIISNLIFTNER